VLSAFAAGRGTALVLDVGGGQATAATIIIIAGVLFILTIILMRQASAVAVHDGYVLNKPLRRSPLGGDRIAELMRPLPRCSAPLSATRSRSRPWVVVDSPRAREAAARTHRHVPTLAALATQTKTRGHQASSLPSRSVRDRPSSPPQAHLAAEPRVASAAAAALHAEVAGRRRLPRHGVPALPSPALPRPAPRPASHPLPRRRHAPVLPPPRAALPAARGQGVRLPPPARPSSRGGTARGETRRDAPRCAEMRRDVRARGAWPARSDPPPRGASLPRGRDDTARLASQASAWEYELPDRSTVDLAWERRRRLATLPRPLLDLSWTSPGPLLDRLAPSPTPSAHHTHTTQSTPSLPRPPGSTCPSSSSRLACSAPRTVRPPSRRRSRGGRESSRLRP